MHQTLHPDDGLCKCDNYHGWYKNYFDISNPWDCTCYKMFLTVEGECSDCGD